MDPREVALRGELAQLNERINLIIQDNMANPEARAANQELLADAQVRIRSIRAQLAAPVSPVASFPSPT